MNAFLEKACGGCGKFNKDGPYTPEQCRVCYLYFHDSKARDLWDKWPRPDPTIPPCKWRNLTGELVICRSPKVLSEGRAFPLQMCKSCEVCDHPDDGKATEYRLSNPKCDRLWKRVRENGKVLTKACGFG